MLSRRSLLKSILALPLIGFPFAGLLKHKVGDISDFKNVSHWRPPARFWLFVYADGTPVECRDGNYIIDVKRCAEATRRVYG